MTFGEPIGGGWSEDVPEQKSGLTDLEAAAISAHVYGDKSDDILIGGWHVSDREIEDVMWSDDNSGFKSALYERTLDNGTTEYVYATAGTQDLPDAATDAA